MTDGTFRTEDGCLLAYEDVGEGMPVLWQHGLGADRTQPAEVFPAIPGIRRLTLECRGHGNSEMGDTSRLSIATFAADAIALLDHLRIRQAIVGGISLGAALSMRLAALALRESCGFDSSPACVGRGTIRHHGPLPRDSHTARRVWRP